MSVLHRKGNIFVTLSNIYIHMSCLGFINMNDLYYLTYVMLQKGHFRRPPSIWLKPFQGNFSLPLRRDLHLQVNVLACGSRRVWACAIADMTLLSQRVFFCVRAFSHSRNQGFKSSFPYCLKTEPCRRFPFLLSVFQAVNDICVHTANCQHLRVALIALCLRSK